MPEKRDIRGRDEIVRLVDHFYGKVRGDATLGFIFEKIPDPKFDPANLTPEQRARYAAYKRQADA